MKIFNLGVYNLKDLEKDLEICFVEHILEAMMKRAPTGVLYNLGIQQW